MESAASYIPIDRQRALARAMPLPDRSHGAALLADISGFTPLTELLVQTLGIQRGAEELTRQLDLVFDALITEVHAYDGSVIGFSGDALTCWFEADDGLRATACALAMQKAMSQFATVAIPRGGQVSIAMKAAVAAGEARRFAVGDPSIQVIDVLAGATLDRLGKAEQHATRGEVVLDALTAEALGARVRLGEWRDERRYALVESLAAPVAPSDAGAHVEPLDDETVRPWLLATIYPRVRSGQGEFLAELRPAVALFLSFDGIDYDRDEDAPRKLDAFTRWVQSTVARFDGALLQLNFDDKGSYLQIAFGAPIAHVDDAARAVAAALELRDLPSELSFIQNVRIGISSGRTRTGPYGGRVRRTYGVLGDEVNLAARLMQHAEPSQILVSAPIADATRSTVPWEALPPIRVKGKAEPVEIFTPAQTRTRRGQPTRESLYALPMVGRQSELARIQEQLALAERGEGRIVAVTGDAGVGKTRLVNEVMRLARTHNFELLSGECQSFGMNSAYHVWHEIWHDFFGLDERADNAEQVQQLESALAALDPAFMPRMPLLAVALNLSIPDNDLTRSLDARLRKQALEALLVDCLKARVMQTGAPPFMLVLEDCHWLDPLSHDLLETISRELQDLPILVVLAYRKGRGELAASGGAPRVVALPYCIEVALNDFSDHEAEELIDLKLRQFNHEQSNGHAQVPAEFVKRVSQRAQGNPFYIEELLNYLHRRGLDPSQTQALDHLDWPDSLHRLILSRIDQLSESQRVVLKVASIIGRLFVFEWLWGVYPELGAADQVEGDIETLQELDLTPLEAIEPEVRYMFKHIVTHEVAYQSQPYAARAQLHEQLAQYVEQRYSTALEKYTNLLAHHYGRANNVAKQKEYFLKAGRAAEAAYAPEAAIGYYQKALALAPGDDPAQLSYRLKVYEGLGRNLVLRARYHEAIETYRAMCAAAEPPGYERELATAWYGLSNAYSQLGEHRLALNSAARSEAAALAAHDRAALAGALELKGRSLFRLGDNAAALALGEQIVQLTSESGERIQMTRGLNLLGAIHNILGQYAQAEQYFARAYDISESIGDRSQMMTLLNNLGVIASARGDYQSAEARYRAVLDIAREIGHRSAELITRSNLGAAQVRLHDYESAAENLREVIEQSKHGGTDASADTYNFLAEAYLGLRRVERAQQAALHALRQSRALGIHAHIGAAWRALGLVAAHLPEPLALEDAEGSTKRYDARACFTESARIFAERRMEGERARTLRAWARYECERGDRAVGERLWAESRAIFTKLGAEFEVERMRELPARVSV